MAITQFETFQRKETKLVGYSVTASLNEDLDQGIVVNLRNSLLAKQHEIIGLSDNNGLYLIQIYPDVEWTPDVPFESIVAVEVHNFDGFSEDQGLVQHTLPAGSYVKVSHQGPEDEIAEAYDTIRERDISSNRCFDFEYWPDASNFDPEDCKIDIYLPTEE
ncbi:GyrI-like domain-containing protein [Paenibacillus sp. NPDC058071]|uniref:GyrI-like domain-containing protein n=1 Tax=Paenibacillus sp. NPDC058071 TaxID=3346326 RepID=UPI0036DBD65A